MTLERKNIKVFLFALLLLVAVTVTYSNHFHNTFHFDDMHTIVNNVYIKNIRNIPLFFKDATTISSLPANQSYRPVFVTSVAFDYWLGNGLKPFYFHLSMFVLFLMQAVLMYLLFIKIFDTVEKHPWNVFVALFAVSWYMLHPANAETINYICARSDSISTFFGMLSLVLYLYSPLSRKWFLYLVPFALAMLTKPIAAVFTVLLFLYHFLFDDLTVPKKSGQRTPAVRFISALKKTAPLFLFSILMLFFLKSMNPVTFSSGASSAYRYIITQPYVILHYFKTFFLPIGLSADTDLVAFVSAADPRFFAGIIFLAIFLYIIYVLSKDLKMRPIAFGLLWFLIALLPTSLFPLAEVLNDHRLFFPYIGLTAGICHALFLGLTRLMQRISVPNSKFAAIVSVLIILMLSGYAYGTHQRNKVWNTDESLWKDVTEKSPKNGRGLMNYGLSLMARGDYTGAEIYFLRALEFTPNYSYLQVNFGVLKAALGKHEEAEQFYKKAISLNDRNSSFYSFYGRFLKDQKRYDEAALNLTKALELSAANPDARHQLMQVYYEINDTEKLRALAEQTLTIVPDDRQAMQYLEDLKSGNMKPGTKKEVAGRGITPEYFLNLSLQYFRARQFEKSIEAARKALQIKPDYDQAYNNICAAYNELGQWDRAIEAGEKAVKLNPNNQLARNNLAVSIKGKQSERKSTGKSNSSRSETGNTPEALSVKRDDQQDKSNLGASTKGREAEQKSTDKSNASRSEIGITPEALVILSLKYYQIGLFEESIKAAKEALELKPDNDTAYNNICAAYNELGQGGEAIKYCEQALKINPSNKLANNNLLRARQLSEKPQKAGTGLKAPGESQFEGKSFEDLIALSLKYFQAGQYEYSLEASQAALRHKPNSDLAYNNICSAYNGLAKWDKAIDACKSALKINPRNQLARNNLAWAETSSAPPKSFWDIDYWRPHTPNFLDAPKIGKWSFPAVLYVLIAVLTSCFMFLRPISKERIIKSFLLASAIAGILFAARTEYTWFMWMKKHAGLINMESDYRAVHFEYCNVFDFAKTIRNIIPPGDKLRVYVQEDDDRINNNGRPYNRGYFWQTENFQRQKIRYHVLPIELSDNGGYIAVFMDNRVVFDPATRILRDEGSVIAENVSLIKSFSYNSFLYKIEGTRSL